MKPTKRALKYAEARVPPEGTITRAMEVWRMAQAYTAGQRSRIKRKRK